MTCSKDGLKRSQSLKTQKRSTTIRKSNTFYEKPAVESVNVDDDESEEYRLREFETNGKRVVSRGDSFRTRKSSPIPQPTRSRKYSIVQPGKSVTINPVAVNVDTPSLPSYRVLLSGARGVGKTSLSQQFLTSEYINIYDRKFGSSSQTSVTLKVDDHEAELTFVDVQGSQCMSMSQVDAQIAKTDPHCLLLIFSVTDNLSFHYAADALRFLKKTGTLNLTAVILVANKVDMVRTRVVPAHDGKHLAKMFDCKYIETSSGFQHNVDELLVGCLRQIQLKTCPSSPEVPKRKKSPMYKRKKSASDKLRGLLNKVLGKTPHSCEDLHAL